MLKITGKTMNIIGISYIDDVEAARFNVTLNSQDPLAMSAHTQVINGVTYKSNITQCRADEAEFVSYMQSLQDDMIEAQGADEETSEE